MNYLLLLYELSLLPIIAVIIWFTPKNILKQKKLYVYTLVVAVFLTLWGEVAIAMQHWFYPDKFNIGIKVLNQPIELYLDAVATTLIIICFWEWLKRTYK